MKKLFVNITVLLTLGIIVSVAYLLFYESFASAPLVVADKFIQEQNKLSQLSGQKIHYKSIIKSGYPREIKYILTGLEIVNKKNNQNFKFKGDIVLTADIFNNKVNIQIPAVAQKNIIEISHKNSIMVDITLKQKLYMYMLKYGLEYIENARAGIKQAPKFPITQSDIHNIKSLTTDIIVKVTGLDAFTINSFSYDFIPSIDGKTPMNMKIKFRKVNKKVDLDLIGVIKNKNNTLSGTIELIIYKPEVFYNMLKPYIDSSYISVIQDIAKLEDNGKIKKARYNFELPDSGQPMLNGEPLSAVTMRFVEQNHQNIAAETKSWQENIEVLAWTYLQDISTAPKEELLEILNHLSLEGTSWATNELGRIYETGSIIEVNLDKAHKMYQMAANQDNTKAIYNLARLYHYGIGVEVDYKKAVELYEKNAAKNHPESIAALGVLYYQGLGIEQDIDRAKQLFEQAVELGLTEFADFQSNIQ